MRTHTNPHTHPPRHPPPPCPAPCLQVLLQSTETCVKTSHLAGFGGLGRKGKAGFAPERGTALQSSAWCGPCPLIPGSWERPVGAAVPRALPRQMQAASGMDTPKKAAVSTGLSRVPCSSWMQRFSRGTGSPTCVSRAWPLCQALGLHIELPTWARRGCLGK